MAAIGVLFRLKFQSTLPVGGATIKNEHLLYKLSISIHAPRGGSDKTNTTKITSNITFQSTLPVGGATQMFQYHQKQGIFQSTLPVGGATEAVMTVTSRKQISIHAPRGGSDIGISHEHGDCRDFNPRSPWGERPEKAQANLAAARISIHAPRGGSDAEFHLRYFAARRISIHAPRGGSDLVSSVITSATGRNFNPRSPWGERLPLLVLLPVKLIFQSTLPVGGATWYFSHQFW